jgi:hypothetical protein
VLLPAFAVYEARFARHPIMPPRVFNNRTATGAFLVNVTLNFASMPLSVYLTLYLQVVKGLSPGFAGACILSPCNKSRISRPFRSE